MNDFRPWYARWGSRSNFGTGVPEGLKIVGYGVAGALVILAVFFMSQCSRSIYVSNIESDTGGVVVKFETVWWTTRCGVGEDGDTAVNATVKYPDGSLEKIKACCNISECY